MKVLVDLACAGTVPKCLITNGVIPTGYERVSLRDVRHERFAAPEFVRRYFVRAGMGCGKPAAFRDNPPRPAVLFEVFATTSRRVGDEYLDYTEHAAAYRQWGETVYMFQFAGSPPGVEFPYWASRESEIWVPAGSEDLVRSVVYAATNRAEGEQQ